MLQCVRNNRMSVICLGNSIFAFMRYVFTSQANDLIVENCSTYIVTNKSSESDWHRNSVFVKHVTASHASQLNVS